MTTKSKKLVLTAIVLLFAMLATYLGIITKGFRDFSFEKYPDAPYAIDGNGNRLVPGEVYDLPSELIFNSVKLAAGGGALELTVQATVTPAYATNKAVDFSVAWGAGASRAAQAVSGFLTVTPASDGSNVATIRCFQGFGDDIILLTVTTRDGGLTATCNISFQGIPTSMTISHATLELENFPTLWSRGYGYRLGARREYYFDVNFDNEIHDVGARFKNISISTYILEDGAEANYSLFPGWQTGPEMGIVGYYFHGIGADVTIKNPSEWDAPNGFQVLEYEALQTNYKMYHDVSIQNGGIRLRTKHSFYEPVENVPSISIPERTISFSKPSPYALLIDANSNGLNLLIPFPGVSIAPGTFVFVDNPYICWTTRVTSASSGLEAYLRFYIYATPAGISLSPPAHIF